MPNWCENELKIWGLADDVQAVLDHIRSKEPSKNSDDPDIIDFNQVIPYPEEYRLKDREAQEALDRWRALPEDQRPNYSDAVPKDGFNSGGYDWCVRNWGTKWNACDRMMLRDDTKGKIRTVGIGFSTAWAPPEPIIRELAQIYSMMNFQLKYWECGAGFKGTLEFRRGQCVKDETDRNYRGDRGG